MFVAYRGMASRKAYGPLVSQQSSKIDKETSNFIRHYCRKWKAKTIFQVLLQYRAARFQDLFNLSQQIHLFNQSVVNDLLNINQEMDFDCIDSRAQVGGWIGRRKPTVLKIPFRLEDIPYFDTVYLCDPSQRQITGSKETEEAWDAPLRRKNNVSSQIVNATQGYSQSELTDENQRIRKTSDDKIIFIPFNRNPEEPVRRLSTFQPEHDYSMHYGDYHGSNYQNQKHNRTSDNQHQYSYKEQSYSRNSGYNDNCRQINKINSRNNQNINITNDPNRNFASNTNTKSAKDDFEYVNKPMKNYYQTPKTTNKMDPSPIEELQQKFKRNSENTADDDEDDPPFNFRAMLRKTNYNRDSFRNREENTRTFSFKNKVDNMDETNNSHSSRNDSLRKSYDSADAISTELAPGLIVKGYVADL